MLACIKFDRAASEKEEEAEVKDPEVEANVAAAGTARLVRLDEMSGADPLRADAPHFAKPTTQLLFEPRERDGGRDLQGQRTSGPADGAYDK